MGDSGSPRSRAEMVGQIRVCRGGGGGGCSPCRGLAPGCPHAQTCSAQSLNFLPPRRRDGWTAWVKCCRVDLRPVCGLHLGGDPSVLSGLNGFVNDRVMEAVGARWRTGPREALNCCFTPTSRRHHLNMRDAAPMDGCI